MTLLMATSPICLVTGASSGIGKAIAKVLLQNNFIVYAAARRVEKMTDIANLGAIVLPMDITQSAQIEAAVAKIQAAHGGVDILINNAGFGSYGAMEDTPIEAARYQFEVNLFGLARLTQAVLPYMRNKPKAGQKGIIVNMSSMGGKIYFPLGSWYHASKHALEGWSDCLRLELAPFDIDVVIIEPGIIETEFSDVMVGPLLKRSGNSAYAPMARSLAKSTQDSYEKGGSSPDVIAQVVLKAVTSPQPKTRYVAGRLAWPLLLLRKWLPDRAFDWAISQAI